MRIKKEESEDNYGYLIGTGFDHTNYTFGELEANYADISGGGLSSGSGNLDDMPYGALTSEYAIFDIKNCNFHDNEVAISTFYAFGEITKINRTKFSENNLDVFVGFDPEGFQMTPANFKYDWWGSPNGPEKDENKEYRKIIGSIDLRPWFVSEDFHDPLIVIPGIMGSATEYPGGIGELKVDPILHTYDNLIASLEENGYEKGKNLFEFPYEWRDSNVQTAGKLKEKINEVKNETGLPAVDIVAHSMGGLVARYYIEGESYENDVNQLITLGTPHKGSPEAYLKWEAGEGFFTITDKIGKIFFEMEALHSGYSNLRDYIQARILSVKELLPDYDYLEEISSGEMRCYFDNYPRNMFLEFLNGSTRLDNLKKVYFTNIVGENNRNNTITKFRVDGGNLAGNWIHGMPENYYDDNTDQGIEYGQGDETVPLSSAEGIPSDDKIIMDSSHGNIPTEAQCDVFKKLTNEESCESVSVFDRVVDILTFGVFSPVDIQIIDPGNKKIGKNFETGEIINEIDGAFYSGFETKNEFLTIPNPVNGEYKIIMQGTEDGEYKIETYKIIENENDSQNIKELTEVIEGVVKEGETRETKIEISKEGIVKKTVSIDTIREDIDYYFKIGLIKNKSTKRQLDNQLKHLGNLFELLEKTKNSKLKPKLKQAAVSALEKAINADIDLLVRWLERK